MTAQQSFSTIAEAPHADHAASSFSYDLNGYCVLLDLPDPTARATVVRILGGSPLPASAASSPLTTYALRQGNDALWEVTVAGHLTYGSASITNAMVALEWQIVTDMIAYRRDLFHLHAASLMVPTRATSLLIAGESGSGKTTLALGLMARGFLPYSDDVTFIDPDTNDLLPFRRAFHIDSQTQSLLHSLSSPPDWDFDAAPAGYFSVLRWAEIVQPIRTILFPTLMPGATPTLTPLSLADGVARLLPFSVTLAQSPALALRTAAAIVGNARCYALTAGDFAATLDCVTDHLQREAALTGHR